MYKNNMKRRQFLKILAWSPIALIVPKVLTNVKPISAKPPGGYIIHDKDIAFELQRRLDKRDIIRTFRIPESLSPDIEGYDVRFGAEWNRKCLDDNKTQ